MPPTVYLFYGDDAAEMQAAVNGLQNKIGDATVIEMNTTRFEGTYSLESLSSPVHSSPFLAARRLVVATNPGKIFGAEGARDQFKSFLQSVPETTAVVLVEHLPSEDKKYWENNWLVKWAKGLKGEVFVKEFSLLEAAAMGTWIRERTKELGGEMQPQAAAALAQLIGSDKTSAENEIQKLLAYAAYIRPVTAEDVEAVSLPIGEHGDFFKLIDSLSAGNSAKAIQQLETLFQERELIVLYFSLVGHFRALLQTRALLDAGKNDQQISKELGMHPFRAEKLAAQALRFSKQSLDAIYNRLLQYDEEVKTGELDWELAMETFVAELSSQLA